MSTWGWICWKNRKRLKIWTDFLKPGIDSPFICPALITFNSFWSSLPVVFVRNFAKFTGKHQCQSPGPTPATLLKKRPWHNCFSLNFAKFLQTSFVTKHFWWRLLHFNAFQYFVWIAGTAVRKCSTNKVILNFEKFTGKYLRWSLFFNKVASLQPAMLLKKETLCKGTLF